MPEAGLSGTRSTAESARHMRLPRRPARTRRTLSHVVCAATSAQPASLSAGVEAHPSFELGFKAWSSAPMIFGRSCGSGESPCNSSNSTILKSRDASLPVARFPC